MELIPKLRKHSLFYILSRVVLFQVRSDKSLEFRQVCREFVFQQQTVEKTPDRHLFELQGPSEQFVSQFSWNSEVAGGLCGVPPECLM